MLKAIEKGWEGVEKGQEPFGSCITRKGEIVSICHNTVKSSTDITAHAEMNAIREACRKLGTTDLSDCEIYATFKPCQMCVEACKRAGISNIYYGAGPENVKYPMKVVNLDMKGGLLFEKCLELTSNKYKRDL
jgi:tRNA(Arg) A34 adenosine deaminase TadA